MAIFWNHIKGTNSEGGYSWIKWKNDTNPELLVNNTNNETGARNLGAIITSQVNWNLNTDWTWNNLINNVSVGSWSFQPTTTSNPNHLTIETFNPLFVSKGNFDVLLSPYKEGDTEHDAWFQIKTKRLDYINEIFTVQAKYANQTDIELKNPNYFKCSFYTYVELEEDVTFKKNIQVNGHGEFTDYCRALYFSATSDKRAKENIVLANFSALDFIQQTPVYSFNYKNNTIPMIGIMAQDITQTELKEVLVDNCEASGENNDYMSIKEDKLIFVLMKAIQEQQEQIELLKREILTLKGGK